MAKRKDRITPTLEPKEEPQEEFSIVAPVEIQFHIAGANVEKYSSPQGNLTVLSLISPAGLAVSVKLSDENVTELVKDLQGEKSAIETYAVLPPGLAK